MKPFLTAVICILFLNSCHSGNKIAATSAYLKLHGTWQLNYISGSRIAFDGLYPDQKPTISFDVSGKRVSGNTSCNNFSGSFEADGNKISFSKSMATTKMACPGEGEPVFLKTLLTVNSFDVTEGYTLSLFTDGVASLRFTKSR